MLGSAIIVFREVLEAALIIGILGLAALAGRFLHTLVGFEAAPTGMRLARPGPVLSPFPV